ncbi:MAG: glutathione S-transferase [Proteobacteria bacterium]|nr:glutathione S-transferase [Pseudomonadota bacterium]
MSPWPILYSFRRCPYAMRARMALYQAEIKCELREIVLKDKPDTLIAYSEKATVPVLITPTEEIIDQSLKVIFWALEQNDPQDWLAANEEETRLLINDNDNEFKYYLDRYKYHVAYPEYSQEHYRDKALPFLDTLEQRLDVNQGIALVDRRLTLADTAIFPFVRQFANVDLNWFQSSHYTKVIAWYTRLEQSILFTQCMIKYEQWVPGEPAIMFPA